jgi:hypothetical protein
MFRASWKTYFGKHFFEKISRGEGRFAMICRARIAGRGCKR